MVIRVYKDVARFTLLALAWARDNGYDVPQIIGHCRKESNPNRARSNEEKALIQGNARALADVGFQYEGSINNLIEELIQQLQKADSPNADGSLIDEIIKILRLPYARNNIQAEQLTRLRRAILMPDEVAALQLSLDELEAHCSGCGRKFQDSEMVTFRRNEGRHSDRSFLCVRCVPPDVMPCQHCAESHPVPRNIRVNIGKGPKCEPNAAEPLPAPAEPRPAQPIRHRVAVVPPQARPAVEWGDPQVPDNLRGRNPDVILDERARRRDAAVRHYEAQNWRQQVEEAARLDVEQRMRAADVAAGVDDNAEGRDR